MYATILYQERSQALQIHEVDGIVSPRAVPMVVCTRGAIIPALQTANGHGFGFWAAHNPVSLTTAYYAVQVLTHLKRLTIKPNLIELLVQALEGDTTEEENDYLAGHFELDPNSFMILLGQVYQQPVPEHVLQFMLQRVPEPVLDDQVESLLGAIEAHKVTLTPTAQAIFAPAHARYIEREAAYAEADQIIERKLEPDASLGQLLIDLGIRELLTPFDLSCWNELSIGAEYADPLVKLTSIGRYAIGHPLPLLVHHDSPFNQDAVLQMVTSDIDRTVHSTVETAGPIVIDTASGLIILHGARYDGAMGQIIVQASLDRPLDSELALWDNTNATEITVPVLRQGIALGCGQLDFAPGQPLINRRRPSEAPVFPGG